MERRLFTSESVTEGHPDKICDKISDAVLDEMLRQDPMARVACETFCTTGLVALMGEITAEAYVDFQTVVRETVREIGYDRAKYGFDSKNDAAKPPMRQPIYIAILTPQKVLIILGLPSSVTVNSIKVVASTKPITECDAMECIFSNAAFIALDSRSNVASIVIPKGTTTLRSRLLMPADIGP